MVSYNPPLQDIHFILSRLIGLERLAALEDGQQISADLTNAVLEGASIVARDVFAPLNQRGDKHGAHLKDDLVHMPEGFKEAYQTYVEGGWNGLPFSTDFGGQGLPWCLAMPVQEMLQSANLGLALCTLLNQGAVELLLAHGNDFLKQTFLPKMVSGAWTGVMNLTEPQAGSDVGAIQCRAVLEGDHYKIHGQKIFISYGDHDMTENVIHLVLARLPNAPEGTKGLSLFLVPKFLVNSDGRLDSRNDVHVVSLEHKLGQHASPTCVMAYGDHGGAHAYLVGEENRGISAMFTMMNNARIGVGVQGLALMERSYQQALDYAQSRLQGRSLQENSSNASIPIIDHPDVKRMLLCMKSQIEAARALAYSCAYFIDLSKKSSAPQQRQYASLRVDLLTPIIKSWLTDLANEITSIGVQIYGGMGYIEETGIAQHMRDARVLSIYEGTNGIQANDLVFRKIARDHGKTLILFLEEIEQTTLSLKDTSHEDLQTIYLFLREALLKAREATTWIQQSLEKDPVTSAAVASPFLKLLATLTGGYYVTQMALLAHEDISQNNGELSFLKTKIKTARFYAEQFLPLCSALAVTVTKGSQTVARFSREDLK